MHIGRLLPEYFPKIFGEKENEPLCYEAAELKFLQLQKTINEQLIASGSADVTIYLCLRIIQYKYLHFFCNRKIFHYMK